MKIVLFNLALILTISCSTLSQNVINLEDDMLVGKIDNNKRILLLNEKMYLKEINKAFFQDKSVIDKIEILHDTIIGSNIEYNYISLTSSIKKNYTIVRWLSMENNRLFFKASTNSEVFTYEDLYVSCEGNESCKPRLFDIDNNYIWSCREAPMCVTDEEAVFNPCEQGNTGFTSDDYK